MKTWLIPLAALLTLSSSQASTTVQDGVIVEHVGDSYLFVFPSARGRFAGGSENPAGQITVGQNITVSYALKLIGAGRARFIGVAGSPLPKVLLKVQQSEKQFGFMVKDTTQPQLEISINPSFMAETKEKMSEKISRQGNLSVTLAPNGNAFKIVKVVLD